MIENTISIDSREVAQPAEEAVMETDLQKEDMFCEMENVS